MHICHKLENSTDWDCSSMIVHILSKQEALGQFASPQERKQKEGKKGDEHKI